MYQYRRFCSIVHGAVSMDALVVSADTASISDMSRFLMPTAAVDSTFTRQRRR